MQINDPPPPLPAALNQSLVELVMTQLNKAPDQRSQSAEELLAWIDRVLQEFSVVAPLPEAASAMREWSGSSPDGPSLAGVASRASEAQIAPPVEPTRLPWWAIMLPLVLLLGGVAAAAGVWLWLSQRASTDADADRAAEEPALSESAQAPRRTPLDAELLAAAATGDPKAIETVEERPAKDRAAPDWVALARGRMQLGRHMSALDAYSRALDLDPALTKDRVLLSHVRKAAGYDDTAEPALRIAAVRLGSDGADVLYAVWVATKAKTNITQLARQLVYSREVRARATPALAIALDLREVEACEDIRGLLARATLHSKKGCGDKEQEDCYPCLREGTGLADATSATSARPEPAFLAR
jgi:tetratricopeptide (TPR) repeat protein